jgi:5S rRNA maturation endonuclease (ribonuclease M5)
MEMTTYLNSIDDQSERIEKILTELGYDLSDNGKYWRSNAIYRQGDNKTALQIWKDTGIWKDFVANTGYQPFKRLVELSCNDDSKVSEFISSIEKKEESFITVTKAPKMESDQFFSHDEVKTLLPHYEFYNKKGISDKTLSLYRCGFSMSGKMNGRFVFPIFDENRKVIGISGRHLLWKSASTTPKWKHLGRKTNWIYPINLQPEEDNIFKKTIEEKREVILVEGIGDSLALSEQGYYNHLVVFGLEISSKQLSYLMSLSLDKVIVSTNNDKDKTDNRGLQAAIKIYLKLINYIDINKVEIKLPVCKDFGEMLETNIPISKWEDKKINKISQLEYIIKFLYNNENDKKQISVLKNHLEQLKLERDSISQ